METRVEEQHNSCSQTEYEGLVRTHYRSVISMCYGILGNSHDAQDAAQVAFLKAFKKSGALRQGERFGAWISKIAKNVCIDMLQAKRHVKKLEAAEEVTTKQDSQPDIAGAMAKLPAELRSVLACYYMEGQNSAVIAQRLGISESTVRSRLREARHKLHSILSTGEMQ